MVKDEKVPGSEVRRMYCLQRPVVSLRRRRRRVLERWVPLPKEGWIALGACSRRDCGQNDAKERRPDTETYPDDRITVMSQLHDSAPFVIGFEQPQNQKRRTRQTSKRDDSPSGPACFQGEALRGGG